MQSSCAHTSVMGRVTAMHCLLAASLYGAAVKAAAPGSGGGDGNGGGGGRFGGGDHEACSYTISGKVFDL